MKKYIKPVVEVNEDLAEGVYAASGSYGAGGCWEILSVEKNPGGGDKRDIEVYVNHDLGAQHISNALTIEFEFNYPIASAVIDDVGEVAVSGNKVTVTRILLGNAYTSGDKVSFKVHVGTVDPSFLDTLEVVGYRLVSCDKSANVQGNGGDE